MTIFDQTFFSYHFINKLFFFPKVAEQTIYFRKFAEQSFFSQKNHSPLQESNGRPLKYGSGGIRLVGKSIIETEFAAK